MPKIIFFLTLYFYFSALAGEPKGLEFKETMPGTLMLGKVKYKCKLSLGIRVQDIDKVETEPGIAVGYFQIGKDKFSVSGTFRLMARLPEKEGYFLLYELSGWNREGESILLSGAKHIRKDDRGNIIADATQLYGTAKRSSDFYDLRLRFHWENPINMARFLSSFKVINSDGVEDEFSVRAKFFKIWFGAIYDEYFKF